MFHSGDSLMLKSKRFFWLLASFTVLIIGNILSKNQLQNFDQPFQVQNEIFDLERFEIIENEELEKFLITNEGIASYYASKFHNRRTASGEVFDMFGYTAAHRRLPFGTIVKVENLSNERTTIVRINDRGPFVRGRIIDISYRAAKEILGLGIPRVRIHYFNEDAIIDNFDNRYYLGYSLHSSFIITRKENVEIVAETYNFEYAVNTFNLLLEDEYMEYYLFVEAGRTQRNAKFFIGYINPLVPLEIPDFVE